MSSSLSVSSDPSGSGSTLTSSRGAPYLLPGSALTFSQEAPSPPPRDHANLPESALISFSQGAPSRLPYREHTHLLIFDLECGQSRLQLLVPEHELRLDWLLGADLTHLMQKQGAQL